MRLARVLRLLESTCTETPMLKLIAGGALALSLGACNAVPPPYFLVAPTDPGAPRFPIRYASVTRAIQRFQVVNPKDWRELNRAVGQSGEGGMGNMDHSKMPGMGAMPGMNMGGKGGMR